MREGLSFAYAMNALLHSGEGFRMSANRLRCPSLALAGFLMVGASHYAGAQPLGVNPSAAPSNIGNPSSINPAAAASDIRNPSAINPAAAASQIPRSSVVSPTRPTQAMPRVARQRIAQPPGRARAVQRAPQSAATTPSTKKPKLSNSEVEATKVRAADEARQKAWDAKTKKSMSGICVGC